jgi:uncharacterized protein YceK
MGRVRLAVFAVLCAVVLSGCGTIVNLVDPNPEVYGGLGKDAQLAGTPRSGNAPNKEGSTPGQGNLGGFILLAGDMSLCLVADTLTLPVVHYLQAKKDHAAEAGLVPVVPGGKAFKVGAVEGGVSPDVFRPVERFEPDGWPPRVALETKAAADGVAK